FIVGTAAWNLPSTGTPVAQPQPAAVGERLAEIWTTPHGFVRAARASNPTVTAGDAGESRVEFTLAGRRYEGTIDAKGHVERVRTWIDNPVLGDTPFEVTYADYRPFDDLMFPSRITRSIGGHPVLELNVVSAATSSMTLPPVPAEASAEATPVSVTAEALAPGIQYLRGGSHHSVAIEQADGIVVVEAPQNEERSTAVIAKVKELFPNKPIRFLVNSHQHFDHSGGLRTYVDEGATIVTHEANRAFYESAWAAPRTINADRLAKSGKAAQFQTFTDKLVLDDRTHPVEVHHIAGSGHNDAFALVWLPRERILIEGDAWTPVAAGTPAPTTANPFTRNLVQNIERLKLDVR
ncbi:MBL fold metallo-hydrolase, partial [bacterium]